MSTEAVKWAMDDAPMLLTDKGRPDSTARHVLQSLAEHAHKDGSNAYPTLRRIRYRTGYDRSTVQRALRRLEVGGLITATGMTEYGVTVYRLVLSMRRPASDMEELEAEETTFRAAAAERKRRSRSKGVTHSAPVTVTHSDAVTEGPVTHSASGRHTVEVRDVTHSASGCHALSAALTIKEPPREPPVEPSSARAPEPTPPAAPSAAPDEDDDALRIAQPLIDEMTRRGMRISWQFQTTEWRDLAHLVRTRSAPVLVDHAERVWHAAKTAPYSARYFLPGWRGLPETPTSTAPALRSINGPTRPLTKTQEYLADMAAIADELRAAEGGHP